jgi:hypothetical protein
LGDQLLLGSLLLALIVFSTRNAYLIWNGQEPLLLKSHSDEYKATAEYKRYLSVNVVSPLIWGGMAVIALARLGLLGNKSGLIHALLYVPFVLGWILLIGGMALMVSIFSSGKPSVVIPPPLRSAAAKSWID